MFMDSNLHTLKAVLRLMSGGLMSQVRAFPSVVNFTNILLAAFTYKSFKPSFFCTYILGWYFFM